MFHPTSKDWPTPHRILAFAMGVFAFVLILGYAFLIRPKKIALERKQNAIQEKTIRFNETGLPKDPVLLNEQLNSATRLLQGDNEQDFEGLNALSERTFVYATQAFSAKIHENYPDTLAFIYGATRLDYKELLERVTAEFMAGEESADAHPFLQEQDDLQAQPVWQMIGKLWTIQDVLGKAKEAGLTLASDAQGTKCVNALPVIAYTLQDSSEGNIFLLEFPVKATFHGTLDQFLAFTEIIQTPECFLPMKRLVIKTTPPEALLPGNENLVDQCEFTFQCSAFMMPSISPEVLDELYEEPNPGEAQE